MKIKGRLWFDMREGWWVCKDLDPPPREEEYGPIRYNPDTLADFLSFILDSGQAFEVEITPLDVKKNKRYSGGVEEDVTK